MTTELLRRDVQAGMQELLVRLKPGVGVPAHTHGKEEQMVILSGVPMLLRIEDPMPA